MRNMRTAEFFQQLMALMVPGMASIAGGVLAARLSSMHGERAGLLLGLYYGGTGIGIVEVYDVDP